MLNFIYGSSERIFLNTSIGCNASCNYCYLPQLGVRGNNARITAEDLLEALQNMTYFKKGREGSILSLGCYSECLDIQNIGETFKLLVGLLSLENRIQLATKQKFAVDLAQYIDENRIYKHQVTLYVSMPTISGITKLEPGTVGYEDRVCNIELCERYEIPKVLYIKPFLPNITAKDLSKYLTLVRKYQLPVVVGNYLRDGCKAVAADVGEGLLFDSGSSDEKVNFISELRKYTTVYEHSTEAMISGKAMHTKI